MVSGSFPAEPTRAPGPFRAPFCWNSYRLLRVCESGKNASIRKPMSLLSGFPQRLLGRSTCRRQMMRTRWRRTWKRKASAQGFLQDAHVVAEMGTAEGTLPSGPSCAFAHHVN